MVGQEDIQVDGQVRPAEQGRQSNAEGVVKDDERAMDMVNKRKRKIEEDTEYWNWKKDKLKWRFGRP